jgi:hypothetical protein
LGATRFSIVIQRIRQLRMQKTAITLTILSAARSLDASRVSRAARVKHFETPGMRIY